MARYEKHRIGSDGWTKWFRPVRRGYRAACCDCGLVHEIDFALIPWGNGKKILMRVRRNQRATAAKRRTRKVG